MLAALAPGGCVCTQGECPWLHLKLISSVVRACGDIFPTVEYALCTVPSYPCGQIGFVLGSLDDATGALREPVRAPTRLLQSQLRYYNPAVHRAAFALPQFAAVEIEKAKRGAL